MFLLASGLCLVGCGDDDGDTDTSSSSSGGGDASSSSGGGDASSSSGGGDASSSSSGGDASSSSSGGDASSSSSGGDASSSSSGGDISGLFDASNIVGASTLVDCTLEDGTATQCYQMTFNSNPVAMGPFCPATLDDVGGVGIYDGTTNPGFQVMKRELFEGMEADGYDIVDDQGNIRIQTNMNSMPEPGVAYCLALDGQDLELTFLIPATPSDLPSPHTIETVELFGVSLDGIPLTGHPPSVVDGPPIPGATGGNIPSIDPCGGHPDPAGYYHWHFASTTMNTVLAAFGITEISCSNVAQSATALVGFAKDGYPIYGPEDDSGTPTELDACSGHTGATSDFPAGVYHYHASSSDAPNLPTCLRGSYVRDAMTYR